MSKSKLICSLILIFLPLIWAKWCTKNSDCDLSKFEECFDAKVFGHDGAMG